MTDFFFAHSSHTYYLNILYAGPLVSLQKAEMQKNETRFSRPLIKIDEWSVSQSTKKTEM